MKFLELFGKSAAHHVRNVRDDSAQDISNAQITTKKIDAIESEISAELGEHTCITSETLMSVPDNELLLSQRIEEAALLFASQQLSAARQLLLDATATANLDFPDKEKIAWWMLLEIAEADAQKTLFEQTALAYAQRFETSPPQWRPSNTDHAARPGQAPLLNFRGKLCASSESALKHLEQMGHQHGRFRLELDAITELDIAGCAGLLATLASWHKAGRECLVNKNSAFIAQLKRLTQEGRPDANHAAWLLLIELLRLMNEPDAYEAACLSYSLTYEISPPSAAPLKLHVAACSEFIHLPAIISNPVDVLLQSIRSQSRQGTPLTLDCSSLQRIDFNAATPLLAGLIQIAESRVIEFREISFLVSTLLQLVGGTAGIRMIRRHP